MKILNVVYSLNKGGTERAAQNFASGYAANGHDSRLLFTRNDGPRRDELIANGISVYDLGSPMDVNELQTWGPDVVHVHSHGLQKREMHQLIDLFGSAKFLETNVFSKPSVWEESLHRSFQLSNWCNHLYSLRGGNVEKSAIVPYPVDVARFAPAAQTAVAAFRDKHELTTEDFVIGRVGQSFEGKWSDEIVSVFEILRASDDRIRLLVVNPPEKIREQISASKYAIDVRVIDEIIGDEALSTCYSSIDVFLHIARQGESFGMVLAESLLCETPVVTLATPWGDNSQGEVIGHEIGGLVAARSDRLPTLVKRLKEDENLRRKLGTDGRQRIVQNFSSTAVAEMALAHLRSSPGIRDAILSPIEILRRSDGPVNSLDRLLITRLWLLPFLMFSTGYRSKFKLPFVLGRSAASRVSKFFGKGTSI